MTGYMAVVTNGIEDGWQSGHALAAVFPLQADPAAGRRGRQQHRSAARQRNGPSAGAAAPAHQRPGAAGSQGVSRDDIVLSSRPPPSRSPRCSTWSARSSGRPSPGRAGLSGARQLSDHGRCPAAGGITGYRRSLHRVIEMPYFPRRAVAPGSDRAAGSVLARRAGPTCRLSTGSAWIRPRPTSRWPTRFRSKPIARWCRC
jgi:hypothetical protein